MERKRRHVWRNRQDGSLGQIRLQPAGMQWDGQLVSLLCLQSVPSDRHQPVGASRRKDSTNGRQPACQGPRCRRQTRLRNPSRTGAPSCKPPGKRAESPERAPRKGARITQQRGVHPVRERRTPRCHAFARQRARRVSRAEESPGADTRTRIAPPLRRVFTTARARPFQAERTGAT